MPSSDNSGNANRPHRSPLDSEPPPDNYQTSGPVRNDPLEPYCSRLKSSRTDSSLQHWSPERPVSAARSADFSTTPLQFNANSPNPHSTGAQNPLPLPVRTQEFQTTGSYPERSDDPAENTYAPRTERSYRADPDFGSHPSGVPAAYETDRPNSDPSKRATTVSEGQQPPVSVRRPPPQSAQPIQDAPGTIPLQREYTPMEVDYDPYIGPNHFEIEAHRDGGLATRLRPASTIPRHKTQDYTDMQLCNFGEVLRDIRPYDPNRDLARDWMEHVTRSLEAWGANLDDAPYLAYQYYQRQMNKGIIPADTKDWWSSSFGREPDAGLAYDIFLREEAHSGNATHVLSTLMILAIDTRATRPRDCKRWLKEVQTTAISLYREAGARNPRFFGSLVGIAIPSMEHRIRNFYRSNNTDISPWHLCAKLQVWIEANPSGLKLPEETRDSTCKVAHCLRRGLNKGKQNDNPNTGNSNQYRWIRNDPSKPRNSRRNKSKDKDKGKQKANPNANQDRQ